MLSPRGRAATKAAAEKSRVARLRKPKCGARTRSGGFCRRLPVSGRTRCKLHGGASPRSDQWLRIQWPDPVLEPERYAKKVREIERRRQKQAARVAAMTSQQRERHARWHETHRPGGKAGREKARRDREMAALLNAKRDRVVDPVAEALEAQLAAVRANKARLEAILNEDSE